MRYVATFILSVSLASASALASSPVAQVELLTGKVLVNQGQGFVPAKQGQALMAGDRILVGKDGAASVTYTAAGCSVDVAQATVLSVQAKAPCTEGQNVAAVDSVFVNAARATGANEGGAPYVHIVVPAFLVGAGSIFTFATIHQHNQRHHHPVSRP